MSNALILNSNAAKNVFGPETDSLPKAVPALKAHRFIRNRTADNHRRYDMYGHVRRVFRKSATISTVMEVMRGMVKERTKGVSNSVAYYNDDIASGAELEQFWFDAMSRLGYREPNANA